MIAIFCQIVSDLSADRIGKHHRVSEIAAKGVTLQDGREEDSHEERS
jgi:hypothetical protein